MTSSLSASLDAVIERLTSCALPTPTVLALEAAAELVAKASKKSKRNKVLTELFWVGKKGKELPPEGKKRAIKDLKDQGSVHETKGGKLKLTKQGVEDFAAISKKKAELVEKGVRKHASTDVAAGYGDPPNAVVVKVYNIGDKDTGEEDWVVDAYRADIEPNSERTSFSWFENHPLPPSVLKLLSKERNEHMQKAEAVALAKKVIKLLEKNKETVKSKIAASAPVSADRDHAVIVTIPIPEKYAKRFPDPVTANHGHMPHMTVLFVGTKEYQPGEMSQILSLVRAACRKMKPFRLYVDPNSGLQDFGPNEEKGEKALWLPARSEPRGEVERLHRLIRMALEQEGVEVGSHDSFKPHVTWSYVPNDQSEKDCQRMNASVADAFKEGFYFDVRHVMLSDPSGTQKVIALSPLPRKQ